MGDRLPEARAAGAPGKTVMGAHGRLDGCVRSSTITQARAFVTPHFLRWRPTSAPDCGYDQLE